MKKLLIYSVAFLFSFPLEGYSQNTYYSQFSGNWTEEDMWNTERDGSGTPRIEPTGSPWGDPGESFVIQTAHELTINGRTQVFNLTVEAGGKLSRGSASHRYIEIFGEELLVAGQLGDGGPDDAISVEIAGTTCEISGGGDIDLWRLRKDDDSSLPLTELTIATDINLWYAGAALYNGGINENAFDVTILEGVTVKVLGRNSTLGSVSIDGPDGTNSGPDKSFGTFTINGTLEISGDLYVVTDNEQTAELTGITYEVNGILKIGGKIYGNEGVDEDADAMGRLHVNSGGELILEGGADIFQSFDPDRNEIIVAEGAILSYAGASSQQIYDGIAYQQLTLSGAGEKVLGGDIRIEEKLEMEGGNIITGGEFTLILNSSDPDALEGGAVDSYIIGNFSRKVVGEVSYYFPIGEAGEGGFNPFILNVGSDLVGEEVVAAKYNSAWELLDLEQECDTEEGNRRLFYSCAVGNWEINSNPFSYDISLIPSETTLNACTEAYDFPTIRKTEGSEVQLGCNAGISGVPFSSFSSFSVAFASVAVVAPVELLYFEVEAEGSVAELSWMTASESNNSHFVIERSENGEVFEELAQISGAGTTQIPQEYTYRDEKAGIGRKYYRIKQVDFNGDYQYFHIREVYLKNILEPKVLAAYPNPADNSYHLELLLPPSDIHTLVVSDLQGHTVYQATLKHPQEGYNACHFDVSNWQPGLYLYKIQAGAHHMQGKLVKR